MKCLDFCVSAGDMYKKWRYRTGIICCFIKELFVRYIMVVVNVDGKDYELTEKHEAVMEFLREAQAIEQGGVHLPPLR